MPAPFPFNISRYSCICCFSLSVTLAFFTTSSTFAFPLLVPIPVITPNAFSGPTIPIIPFIASFPSSSTFTVFRLLPSGTAII